MMSAWLSFTAAVAGFGLISLTMQRHASAWPQGVGVMWRGPRGRAALRLAGAASLAGSGVVAFQNNVQLGAIHWSAYLMVAALIITGLHAFAERWVPCVVLFVVTALFGLMFF